MSKIVHAESCECIHCRLKRIAAINAAYREELAGRSDAFREAHQRPAHWRPQPGTKKAIEHHYPERKRQAS